MRNWLFMIGLMLWVGCEKDPKPDPGDLSGIPYGPQPLAIVVPSGFPSPEIPVDNPITKEGVELGRRLFYDQRLSIDGSMSCASCHLQDMNFTDQLAVSPGVRGFTGRRSAMALVNVGLYNQGLFWDGRSKTLEEQALLPVEDTLELNHRWSDVIPELRQDEDYPRLFRLAFGIKHKDEIDKELAAKAIAQFERTLVSSGKAKYDRVLRNEDFFTEQELNGYLMYFDLDPLVPDAECAHCHAHPLFTTNEYINNGIEKVSDLTGFPDKGRGEVTTRIFDNGRFRVPTLRNVLFTAPFMHDGRFATIEDVIDHYNSGGHQTANKDALIRPLGLTVSQKADLIAFLKTLSDSTFLTDPAFSSPF